MLWDVNMPEGKKYYQDKAPGIERRLERTPERNTARKEKLQTDLLKALDLIENSTNHGSCLTELDLLSVNLEELNKSFNYLLLKEIASLKKSFNSLDESKLNNFLEKIKQKINIEMQKLNF